MQAHRDKRSESTQKRDVIRETVGNGYATRIGRRRPMCIPGCLAALPSPPAVGKWRISNAGVGSGVFQPRRISAEMVRHGLTALVGKVGFGPNTVNFLSKPLTRTRFPPKQKRQRKKQLKGFFRYVFLVIPPLGGAHLRTKVLDSLPLHCRPGQNGRPWGPSRRRRQGYW